MLLAFAGLTSRKKLSTQLRILVLAIKKLLRKRNGLENNLCNKTKIKSLVWLLVGMVGIWKMSLLSGDALEYNEY